MKNALTNIKENGLNLLARGAVIATSTFAASQTTMFSAFAGDADDPADLNTVVDPIVKLINSVFLILIPLIGAVGALFCITLGIKYSKAEEPQEREKAKQHLKNAIIGFVLIFVLVVVLRLATPRLTAWMSKTGGSGAIFNGFLF